MQDREACRPKLSPGLKLEILFQDPVKRWIEHDFVEWADSPICCRSCGHPINHPRFVARGQNGKLIMIDYTDKNKWRTIPQPPPTT